MNDPFAALRLPARPDLADEHVRAAWRAVAAATHPDRADGGDPARYAAASAAYAVLLLPARVRRGRPLRLMARALAAVLLGVIAARSGAGGPAAAGVVTGLGVWLLLTVRGDLAPPPGR